MRHLLAAKGGERLDAYRNIHVSKVEPSATFNLYVFQDVDSRTQELLHIKLLALVLAVRIDAQCYGQPESSSML